jgi:hypothetical protein
MVFVFQKTPSIEGLMKCLKPVAVLIPRIKESEVEPTKGFFG